MQRKSRLHLLLPPIWLHVFPAGLLRFACLPLFFFGLPILIIAIPASLTPSDLSSWSLVWKVLGVLGVIVGFFGGAIGGAFLGIFVGKWLVLAIPCRCPLCGGLMRNRDFTYRCRDCGGEAKPWLFGPLPFLRKYILIPIVVVIFASMFLMLMTMVAIMIGAAFPIIAGIFILVLAWPCVRWLRDCVQARAMRPCPRMVANGLLVLGTIAVTRAITVVLIQGINSSDAPWKEISEWQLNLWRQARPLGWEWWFDALSGVLGIAAMIVYARRAQRGVLPRLKKAAAYAVTTGGTALCVGMLVLTLPSLSVTQWNQYQIAHYLGESDGAAFLRLLRSPVGDQRANAARVLLADPHLLAATAIDTDLSLRLTRDEQPVVRSLAMRSLTRIPGAAALDGLRQGLRDVDWSVRASAAAASGERAEPALVAALTAAFAESPPPEVPNSDRDLFRANCRAALMILAGPEAERLQKVEAGVKPPTLELERP